MSRQNLDELVGLFAGIEGAVSCDVGPVHSGIVKPAITAREARERRGRDRHIYLGAEIPVVATITRKTVPRERSGRRVFGGYDTYYLDIDHAGASEDQRKAGFVRASAAYSSPLGGEIGRDKIERKKIRELLGADIVNSLPRGFKVGQEIPFTAWAFLWDPVVEGAMTIEDPTLAYTRPVPDIGGRFRASWLPRLREIQTSGFLMVEDGPGAGLTVEYSAEEMAKALQLTEVAR